jgi:hypothetical protein
MRLIAILLVTSTVLFTPKLGFTQFCVPGAGGPCEADACGSGQIMCVNDMWPGSGPQCTTGYCSAGCSLACPR